MGLIFGRITGWDCGWWWPRVGDKEIQGTPPPTPVAY